MNKKYDVALIGLAVGANYGSMLTYFSIAETLKTFGKSVLVVNKINAKSGDLEIQKNSPAVRFIKKYNELSYVYSLDSIKSLNDLADTFVVGSDQVWNYGIAKSAGKSFYLDFADGNKRKISISSSMGHPQDFAPDGLHQELSELFQRFNLISVREDDAVIFLKKRYGVASTRLIDPIFYTDNKKYFEVANDSSFDTSGDYLLSYILDKTDQKMQCVEKMANQLGLKIKNIPDGFESIYGKSIHEVVGGQKRNRFNDVYFSYIFQPEDFLKLFRDSQFVVTDSFHGSSFAAKFNKNFASIINNSRGGSRFSTLFNILELSNRAVIDAGVLIDNIDYFAKPIDFDPVNRRIKQEVKKAKRWIRKALEVNPARKIKTYPLVSD